MAKEGKTLTADEAKEKLTSAKEKLIAAKDDLKKFCKENGIKASEDHSDHDDEKIAKKWKKLRSEVDEKEARVEKYQALSKETKKSKGGGAKKAKYSYPKECKTSADKKQYRTTVRAKTKKLGITVDEYLADPEKAEAKLAKMKGTDKKEKKGKKDEEKPAKKKAKKTEEKSEDKPKKKKKATPAPETSEKEEAEEEGGEVED